MIAIESAAAHKISWVLDPVFVDRTPPRASFAQELLSCGPAVLRLNHAEFSALSAQAPSGDAAMAFARTNKIVVALSGETDLITDGERIAAVSNGHPWMTKVTAMGCAGSAIIAACLSIEPDALRATTAALLIIGVAGELAAEKSAGPGSFSTTIIDALYCLDSAAIVARAKVN